MTKSLRVFECEALSPNIMDIFWVLGILLNFISDSAHKNVQRINIYGISAIPYLCNKVIIAEKLIWM